ncbi:hypothetical protein BIV23_43270 [Streptomyces monashensis]|uniref:Uncharacterized protein n=1 Tax=Streptomyces monashensis TaxID=1678012 RepID=A0A1S2P005_9ACTN|nr:hypothetical protein BIV23_43270 [Streptomyces monashensis]
MDGRTARARPVGEQDARDQVGADEHGRVHAVPRRAELRPGADAGRLPEAGDEAGAPVTMTRRPSRVSGSIAPAEPGVRVDRVGLVGDDDALAPVVPGVRGECRAPWVRMTMSPSSRTWPTGRTVGRAWRVRTVLPRDTPPSSRGASTRSGSTHGRAGRSSPIMADYFVGGGPFPSGTAAPRRVAMPCAERHRGGRYRS